MAPRTSRNREFPLHSAISIHIEGVLKVADDIIKTSGPKYGREPDEEISFMSGLPTSDRGGIV